MFTLQCTNYEYKVHAIIQSKKQKFKCERGKIIIQTGKDREQKYKFGKSKNNRTSGERVRTIILI